MSQTLLLDAVLDLNASNALKAALLERRGQPLLMDASAVQRLGGQCLQVLLAAKQTWTADGCPLAITPRSAPFSDALALFGVGERLNDDAFGEGA